MSQEKNLKIVARFRNSLAHLFDEEGLIFSSKNRIYKISDLRKPVPEKIAEIPWSFLKHISYIRIADRFLKNSILQVHKSKKGEYLVATGDNWWLINRQGRASGIKEFSSTRPMSRGICESKGGITYVAGYNIGADRQPVEIFRSKDCCNFDVAWEFPKGQIRHVHALIVDPELESRIWVLTGDLDNESKFYYTDDDFSSLHCFLSAGQKSRATDLIIRNGQLYWGMDSPTEQSSIMKADKTLPEHLKNVKELPGPCYYLAQNEAGAIYAGTTVEPGASLKDNYAHIFELCPDDSWQEIACFKKDLFPQYGILYFPRGILPENFVVFSQRALGPFEGHMTIALDQVW